MATARPTGFDLERRSEQATAIDTRVAERIVAVRRVIDPATAAA